MMWNLVLLLLAKEGQIGANVGKAGGLAPEVEEVFDEQIRWLSCKSSFVLLAPLM